MILNFLNPLNKLTRVPSLKILVTEKEMNKKRNISTDFSTASFKPQKKVIKRNIRKNSFNNLVLSRTEDMNKTGLNNLSYMPSCKLIINKNFSIHKNNIICSKTKFNNNKNKSFNFTLKDNNKIINMNLPNPSIIKKNSKNFRINTRSFVIGLDNLQKNYKTLGHFNNNKKNNNNCNINSFIINKNILEQKDKINSNEKNNKPKTKLINLKKKIISNINNKKVKINNKKNLSTNFKISMDDYIKIIKNSKNKYKNNKDIEHYLKEKKHSLTLSNKNLYTLNDGNIKLLCENIELKRKNEELISKINYISKEFNEIKKDNNDIKEELKEKNNTLNNIKLTMDIFNQELIRLQNQIQINKNNNNNNLNLNNNNNTKIKKINKLNIKGIEINDTNEKTPSTCIGYAYDKKTSSNEIILIDNSNNSDNNHNYSLRDENNISLAENLNINEEEYKRALNNCQNTKKKKNNSYFIKNLNLIMPKQNKELFNDFNQEFLKNVDNFSESWRKEVEKMMQRKGNNNS